MVIAMSRRVLPALYFVFISNSMHLRRFSRPNITDLSRSIVRFRSVTLYPAESIRNRRRSNTNHRVPFDNKRNGNFWSFEFRSKI